MKICTPHWQLCREAVEQNGLSSLISKDGDELAERLAASMEDPQEVTNFDPLFAMSNHFVCEALKAGGLYLMGKPADGSNDGQFCPICEFIKHSKDFDAKAQIDNIAVQMAIWARGKGLIQKVH